MVTTKDFEEHISEEELMGLVPRRWKSRVTSIIFLREGIWEIEAFVMLFERKKLIEAVVMERGDSPVRRWEDLDIDILVKILQSLDLFQLISVIPQVCRAWQLACSDQLLWKTMDLLVLQSNFIRITVPPYVYVDSRSREKLTCLLKICMNHSRGNILTLIFHYNLYVDNNQLSYIAERCPRLKRLVICLLGKN